MKNLKKKKMDIRQTGDQTYKEKIMGIGRTGDLICFKKDAVI